MLVSERTRQVLEWPAVLEGLAARCDSELGRERALSLRLHDDLETARLELRKVGELWRLADEGLALPRVVFADVRPALARAEREGLLLAEQLVEIRQLLDTTGRVQRHLGNQPALAPLLQQVVANLDPLPGLRREIEATIDDHGEVSDDASPELRRLRERFRAQQKRTKDRIDRILHSTQFEKLLQDQYVTVREGRYVLPFVSSVHRELKGIVHHKSQSGATAFMETPELVEMNNKLTMAELEVEMEVERILRKLTQSVERDAAPIRADLAVLADLDLLQARAELGRDLGGALPILDEGGELVLRDARHPLLVLSERPVVGNDLRLRREEGLVITGPNTGGKTVALKTVGLAALMAAAAMPIPAGRDSRVPLYSGVFADIGDDQSLEKDLSTFSAHLSHVRETLADARPGALVMLDELCVGTDPHEGAALATAILEAFVERRCALVVTTHYEELKAKAHLDRRFVNASFGYDPVTFAPSYKLTTGVPGRSGAIDVASRLGLGDVVVQRAREVLGDRGRLDEVIVALESERTAVAKAYEESLIKAHDLEKERLALAAQRDELNARRQEAFEDARAQFLEELSDLREQVRAAVKAAQQAPTGKAAHEARDRIAAAEGDARAHHAAAPAPQAPGAPPEDLAVGARVLVTTFGRVGTVVELLGKKGQVAVDLGGARVVVPVRSLREAPREATASPRRRSSGTSVAAAEQDPVRTPDNTCDVRGMRADDALSAADVFLDRALGEDRPVVFFIHGHGTGALKSALRRYLRESPYVERFRGGSRSEGGDGVTLAWLAGG